MNRRQFLRTAAGAVAGGFGLMGCGKPKPFVVNFRDKQGNTFTTYGKSDRNASNSSMSSYEVKAQLGRYGAEFSEWSPFGGNSLVLSDTNGIALRAQDANRDDKPDFLYVLRAPVGHKFWDLLNVRDMGALIRGMKTGNVDMNTFGRANIDVLNRAFSGYQGQIAVPKEYANKDAKAVRFKEFDAIVIPDGLLKAVYLESNVPGDNSRLVGKSIWGAINGTGKIDEIDLTQVRPGHSLESFADGRSLEGLHSFVLKN
jgi:hypothetical protein